MTLRQKAIVAGGLTTSAACGLALDLMNVPLAWILGPLGGTALFAMLGLPVFASQRGRRLGQMVVGTGLGLNITAALVADATPLLPLMIACAAAAMAIAAAIAVGFAALTRISYPTAFFAMMPGGLAEMANVGASAGAETEPIAVSQSLRVALLVGFFPPVIMHFGTAAPDPVLLSAVELDPLHTASALGLGFAGAALMSLLRLRNPWLVGALVGAGIGTSLGLLSGHLHPWLFAAGQFLIGIALGARFKRAIIARLGPLMLASALATLTLTLALVLLAALVSSLSGRDFIITALSTAPGGMTELSIAAQTLGLPVASIIGFHIVRSMMVNTCAASFLLLLYRLPILRAVDGWLKSRAR